MENCLVDIRHYYQSKEEKTMVNKKSYLGILVMVMVLVFGMTVVGNLGAQTENGGEFILTDLPAKYNGKYAVLIWAQSTIQGEGGWLTSNETGSMSERKSFPIIGGKVIIPLWFATLGERNIPIVERYSGNSTFAIYISIIEKEDVNSKILEKIEFKGGKNLLDSKTNYVQFSNGSATRSYKNKSLVIDIK
jgi:hypothetical protein